MSIPTSEQMHPPSGHNEHGCGCHSGPGSSRCRCRCADAPDEWDVHARIERFIEPAVLLLLREQPRHGYELLDLLPAMIGDSGQADIGNLYRLLRRLEEEGVLSSVWQAEHSGPAKRTYTLTHLGENLLTGWVRALRDAQERITGFLTLYEKGGEI
jgi:poly-beta-hydroxybutyrate-responsive repressor